MVAWPRVCLTMGTVLPAHAGDLLRDLLRAIGELGAEVVVAVDETTAKALQPLPPGVRAAGWLPLSLVLPACDAIVHHGGPGSVMTSLVSGLPQLVVPQASDTRQYAERIAHLGAGRCLLPEQVTAATIQQACAAFLTESRFRDNAKTIAAEIRSQPCRLRWCRCSTHCASVSRRRRCRCTYR